MLVLTRKEGEAVVIGDNVKLTILTIKGSHIRIGIEAPHEIAIQRYEILDTMDDSEDSASFTAIG